MIEQELTKSLRKFIENAVKDFRLPVEHGEIRAPIIINGFLPPKQTKNDDDFPFVVVRPERAASDVELTEVTVSIIIGCYAKDYDGHEYCLNVMTRIRNALATMENGNLDDKYILNFPIEWDIVPEQPWPQWQLDMTTRWSFNTPRVTTDF